MNSSILKEETKEIYLRKARVIDERFSLDGVASVSYDIIFDAIKVGYIDLRRTMNAYMYYYGHVGYHVYEPYRGQRFALKACLKLAKIAKEARGFIYVVSSLGVTGTREQINTDLKSIMAVIRQYSQQPCAIGFGIATPAQARQMASISDGAIVGSAIIKLLARYGKDAPVYIGEYVQSMKDAIRDLE